VYIGFRSATNLRNLPGLNFSVEEAAEGVTFAHRHGVEIYITVNTHPADSQLEACLRAVDQADAIGADAAAIDFYRQRFGISCAILPRVLSLEQIAALRPATDVRLEVMVFGVLCANYDGRCALSSFITGSAAHRIGACAPAELVKFEQGEDGGTVLKLNDITINDFVGAEQRTYPTPCKGKYYNHVTTRRTHAFQDACCLNALPVLPQLGQAGVDIVKIEGRQRSQAYVRSVTSLWRQAMDALDGHERFDYSLGGNEALGQLLEGKAGSLGALAGD
jgi:putative protease